MSSSDDDNHLITLDKDRHLVEEIDFPIWDQDIRIVLSINGLVEHTDKEPSQLESECDDENPLSDPPTPAELSERRNAQRRLNQARWSAYWVLNNGISEKVQNRVRDYDARAMPEPKALYERIKAAYGSNIGKGFSYNWLWRNVYRCDIEENEDPNPKLTMMARKWGQIRAGAPSPDVGKFIDTLAPQAVLNAIPGSYRAAVIHLEIQSDVTMEMVIQRVREEAERRERLGLMVDAEGKLVPKPAQSSRGGGRGRRGRRGRGRGGG